ncbi:MAG: phasin family protein [Microthrixaceae bacterium]
MAQNDVLKRYLDAGLERGQLTQARAEALVRDLVKRGEVQADQARDAVSELVARSRRNSEKLLETIRKEVRAQVTERGLASKADLDKLEARIAKLFGTAATATKKAAAKAAPATKKAPAKKKATTKKAAAKKKATTKKAPARKAPAKKRA